MELTQDTINAVLSGDLKHPGIVEMPLSMVRRIRLTAQMATEAREEAERIEREKRTPLGRTAERRAVGLGVDEITTEDGKTGLLLDEEANAEVPLWLRNPERVYGHPVTCAAVTVAMGDNVSESAQVAARLVLKIEAPDWLELLDAEPTRH